MSIYLNEDETQRCSWYVRDISGTSKPDVQAERPSISYAGRAKSLAAAWARNLAWSWPGPARMNNARLHDASRGSDTAQGLESHFCTERYPSSAKGTTLLRLGFLEDIQDDFEFFVQARRLLGKAEGSWIRQMLPWSYDQVKLSRVRPLIFVIPYFTLGPNFKNTKPSTVPVSIQWQ